MYHFHNSKFSLKNTLLGMEHLPYPKWAEEAIRVRGPGGVEQKEHMFFIMKYQLHGRRGDLADWGVTENIFLYHYLGLDQRLQTLSLWSEFG